MVLGEVIKNLKKFLNLEEKITLNSEIIKNQLKTVGNVNTDKYKVLRGHMNREVVKYFQEENIKLPDDLGNYADSLFNNKIVLNCVELYNIAKDTATSYDTTVKNGGVQEFIKDITKIPKEKR